MANYKQNGGRNPGPEDNRTSWRPQDQPSQAGQGRGEDDRDYRAWRERNYRDADRDPRRWEGSRGSEPGTADHREPGGSSGRYGQGQSGPGAGRYGDDRSQRMQSGSEMFPAVGYDDRRRDFGIDDRFTGHGSDWEDRPGYDPERYHAPGGYSGGRGFESERTAPRGLRGPGEHMGYQSGAGHSEQMGYQRHVHHGTGPHRGKGPVGYRRSDERLRELICESLADDDQLDASQIEVTVKDGEVTLTGSVDDRRAKRDAEDCAGSVSGVRDVHNQLRVTGGQSTGSSYGQPNGTLETEASPDNKHRA